MACADLCVYLSRRLPPRGGRRSTLATRCEEPRGQSTVHRSGRRKATSKGAKTKQTFWERGRI
eukprot:395601-Pyramimonas_sp.AAC.2